LGGTHGGADPRRIERKDLRTMNDAEIGAQAHFLLGARHFLEQMIGQADGRDRQRLSMPTSPCCVTG